jgi:hypothetical protein
MHDCSVMARKKKPTKAELLRAEIEAEHEANLDDLTGRLYNQIIAFTSEAKIPLYHMLVVIEIVKSEVVEQIRKKQGLT